MKKLYSLLIALLLVPGLAKAQSTAGKTYVGYASHNDLIYEYDGLSLDHDAKVGCAIVITRDMLKPYIGGTIKGMRVGWDTSSQTGSYEGFVRNTFNGENLTTGKATVRYSYSDSNPGWNNMTLADYDIPEDVEQLVVGFTTTLKKDVCAIPTLYPHNIPNSCYLWTEGDVDEEGNPVWTDMKDRGILPIELIIHDTKGTFNFLPAITLLTINDVYQTEKAGDFLLRIKNNGSLAIKNMEITSRQGEQTWSQTITTSIAIGVTTKPFLAPIYCFKSGDLELSITKINGTELANPVKRTVNVIGVPKNVASQYKRRPLVEYYESENNYMSARYYDEIVEPGMANYTTKMTLVCQHLDDQFMTGDDDATVLALQLCDNDSSQVSIPAMTIDRSMATDNISFQQSFTYNPMFAVLYEPYASQTYAAALTHPTFVNVNANGELKPDGENIEVNVGGDIAAGIMPEGEKPRLTVYLMEKFVDSDSQLFWTDKEKEASMGHYTHANVIREILTAPEGDEVNAEGEIKAGYATTMAPDWNKENLYIVAFVHRDGKLGGKHMQVFNSCTGKIVDTTGIIEVESSESNVEGSVYDMMGRKVTAPLKGIYIKNAKKVVIR